MNSWYRSLFQSGNVTKRTKSNNMHVHIYLHKYLWQESVYFPSRATLCEHSRYNNNNNYKAIRRDDEQISCHEVPDNTCKNGEYSASVRVELGRCRVDSKKYESFVRDVATTRKKPLRKMQPMHLEERNVFTHLKQLFKIGSRIVWETAAAVLSCEFATHRPFQRSYREAASNVLNALTLKLCTHINNYILRR